MLPGAVSQRPTLLRFWGGPENPPNPDTSQDQDPDMTFDITGTSPALGGRGVSPNHVTPGYLPPVSPTVPITVGHSRVPVVSPPGSLSPPGTLWGCCPSPPQSLSPPPRGPCHPPKVIVTPPGSLSPLSCPTRGGGAVSTLLPHMWGSAPSCPRRPLGRLGQGVGPPLDPPPLRAEPHGAVTHPPTLGARPGPQCPQPRRPGGALVGVVPRDPRLRRHRAAAGTVPSCHRRLHRPHR